ERLEGRGRLTMRARVSKDDGPASCFETHRSVVLFVAGHAPAARCDAPQHEAGERPAPLHRNHSEPAAPACCRTLAQRTGSDLPKRASSSGEALPTGMN